MNKSYCVNCDEVQPYRLEAGTGFWECRVCGCPIECVECGHTMEARHDCADAEVRS